MAMKAQVLGRAALAKRLEQLAPNVEKYAAVAKLEIAKELATEIAARAPKGGDGSYAASIRGDFIRNFPQQEQVGIHKSKDPDATGIVAEFIWRFIEFGTAFHSLAKGAKLKSGKLQNVGPWMPTQERRPHIFSTWRAMKKRARRKLLAAVNKGVKEAMGKK